MAGEDDAVSEQAPDQNLQTAGDPDSSLDYRPLRAMNAAELEILEEERFCKRRISRSISPNRMQNLQEPVASHAEEDSRHHQHSHHHQLLRIQPAIPSNANIRNILENVTKTEGPFKEPEEALKAAISAFTQDAWSVF